jgi:cold-inducible RNA-binding protein
MPDWGACLTLSQEQHVNIFVGNLSRDVSEEELQAAFSAFGQVSKVTILKDKFSGEPRGFGFVEMASKAEAQAAINGMNQKELKGRALNVNEARPRTDRPGGGGGGRSGGANRSGGGGYRGGGGGNRGGGGGNRGGGNRGGGDRGGQGW